MASSDEQAINAVIAAFYAAFDNRRGNAIDGDGLKSLFADDATIARVAAGKTQIWSHDAFIAPRLAILSDGTLSDFHEWETEASTTVIGNIASRVSRYEKAGVQAGKPYTGRGTKFLHLVRERAGWRIVAILWEDETDA